MKMKSKYFTASFLSLLLMSCFEDGIENGIVDSKSESSAKDSYVVVDNKVIREIEMSLRMPDGAGPIERYDRYYHFSGDNFEAIFVRSESVVGVSRKVDGPGDLPAVLDGGCSVINVSGSYTPNILAKAFCNGSA